MPPRYAITKDTLTPSHMADLRALTGNPRHPLSAARRSKLKSLGLIVATDPPRSPTGVRGTPPPTRGHALTREGWGVLHDGPEVAEALMHVLHQKGVDPELEMFEAVVVAAGAMRTGLMGAWTSRQVKDALAGRYMQAGGDRRLARIECEAVARLVCMRLGLLRERRFISPHWIAMLDRDQGIVDRACAVYALAGNVVIGKVGKIGWV